MEDVAIQEPTGSMLTIGEKKLRDTYEALSKQIKNVEGTKMTDIVPVLSSAAGNDGMFGGGGLVGGLILGSLLRNNGNLFGGTNGDGGGVATQSGVQSVVNQSAIQQELADIKAAIPFNEAQMQLALAQQAASITTQLNEVSAASAARDSNTQAYVANGFANANATRALEVANLTSGIANLGIQAERNTNDIEKSITHDGDRTRSLITQQYEATLNRQLTEANNALAELRAHSNLTAATRSIEVNTTNNINQVQAQQQQQQQYQQLAGLVANLANDLQYIRATNQAINIGSGVLAANPTNTNTNVRA